MKTIMKEAEGIKTIINKKNHRIYNPAPFSDHNSAAAPKGGPTGEDERHCHRPVATCPSPPPLSLPDHVPSFHRFKLRQGAKWTIGTTSFSEATTIRLAATTPGQISRHTCCQDVV
jgi:hypothetical protein